MVFSLTLLSLSILIRWHDNVEMAGNEAGCSGWSAVVALSHCALDALHNALLEISFLPVESVGGFFHAVRRSQSLHCLGRQSPGINHRRV